MGRWSKFRNKAKATVKKTVSAAETIAKKPSAVFEDPKLALQVYGMSSGAGAGGAGAALAGASEGRDLADRTMGEVPVAEAGIGDPPTAGDTEIDEAARAQRKKYGRAATLLTSGQGITGQANTVRRTLLGA